MQVDLERLGVAIVTAFELGEHAVVVDLVHALNAFAMPTVPLLLIGAISAHELGDDVEALRWYDAGSSAIADETDRDTLALQDRAHAWVHEGRWSRATRDRLREQAEQWFPKRPSERIG